MHGIVTETDIVYKVAAFGKIPERYGSEVMTKPCIVVNPDLRVEYVARLFAQNGLLGAPVIQGELLGIISVTDILTRVTSSSNPKVLLEQDESDCKCPSNLC